MNWVNYICRLCFPTWSHINPITYYVNSYYCCSITFSTDLHMYTKNIDVSIMVTIYFHTCRKQAKQQFMGHTRLNKTKNKQVTHTKGVISIIWPLVKGSSTIIGGSITPNCCSLYSLLLLSLTAATSCPWQVAELAKELIGPISWLALPGPQPQSTPASTLNLPGFGFYQWTQPDTMPDWW